MLANLADAGGSDAAARPIADWLGSDGLIIFVRDLELGVLLPAPGFPQTLPDTVAWREFLENCVAGRVCARELLSPTTASTIMVTGCAAADGSVLAALGGAPSMERMARACELLPIVAAGLRREQRDSGALAQAKIEHDLAREYWSLAKVLDKTRHNLEYALAETRQALRARDEFIAAASHELRNPLNALQLTSELLLIMAGRGNAVPAEQVAPRAKTLRRQIERLLKLVNSLLDVSRISAGRLVFQIEDFSLDELAREVVDRLGDSSRAAPVGVAAEPVRMRGDKLRIDLVITNLVSNALKYGAGKPIEVKVSATNGQALITVTDHGIGIAPEDAGRIFERFERACSDDRQVGFGLGLWIAREIINAAGGQISVRSAPGEGSTFTVELPRDWAATGAEPRAN